MNPRKIIHIDMDCYYAAIEIRDNPRLKGLPVAVGGSPEGRGVVTTANYEARRFGVRSAISCRRAVQLCPQLNMVRPNFHKYKNDSKKIREIFSRYTKLIEPLSLDEAYLDVSDCQQCSGSATLIAQEIRQKIFAELGLTASAGIAPNKFLAKIASDWNKPNGQFTVKPGDIAHFMPKLQVQKIPGVGKVTSRKMNEKQIFTCGDLQKYSQHELEKLFGKWGERLYELCRGIDNRPVKTSRLRKSFSVENTYAKDSKDFKVIKKRLTELYQDFVYRWQKSNIEDNKVKTHFVKIKYFDFQQTTHEKAQDKFPTLEDFIELYQGVENYEDKDVRLLGVGVRLKTPTEKQVDKNQMSLF